MTLGEISDEISQAVTKFEKNIMGRGPEKINTIIFEDLIIIRLEGFFSVAEQRLARNGEVEQVKKLRTLLFENEVDNLIALIEDITEIGIKSIHSDVSTRTGEKVIIVSLKENLESKIN
ncbi:MAG: DUF2294 domain-containing protein [Halanaerobiales bacterium]